MDLAGIMLSEIDEERQKQIEYNFIQVWNIKNKKKKKQHTHTHKTKDKPNQTHG